MKQTDPLKLLYLQHAESFGGAERQAALIIPRLVQHDIQVIPLIGPGDAIGKWLDKEGFREYRVSKAFPAGWSNHVSRHMPFKKFPALLAQIHHLVEEAEELVQQHGIQLIYASLTFSWLLGGILGKKHHLPVAWRLGGTYLTRFQRSFLHWVMQHWPPAALVANCQSVAQEFQSRVTTPSYTVYNGIDLSQFQPESPNTQATRYRTDDLKDHFVIGFAGRLSPQKNLLSFLDALALVQQRLPRVVLLVAGGDSYLRDELQERANDLGVEEALRFVGFVEDMPSFYASCDVVALPSHSEGCPNVLLEAMAMERPVVATRVGGVPEVVTHGEEGLLVPAGDMEGLGQALLQLADDPDKRQRMGLAGRARVEATFSIDRTAQSLSQVLWTIRG